jgi:DNA polymerase-4
LLLIKAARRLRRAGYYCNGLMLWLALRGGEWSDHLKLPIVNDDRTRQRWERASAAIDGLNARYGRTVMSLGPWKPPAGGHVGGKISYTRIPTAEDFW